MHHCGEQSATVPGETGPERFPVIWLLQRTFREPRPRACTPKPPELAIVFNWTVVSTAFPTDTPGPSVPLMEFVVMLADLPR